MSEVAPVISAPRGYPIPLFARCSPHEEDPVVGRHIQDPPHFLEEVVMKGAFINLSNHPSKGWPKEQIDEALRMSHATIIKDLPFPNINAEMSSDELVEQAKKIAGEVEEKCEDCEPKIAMVQGDFTFSWLVVQYLKAMNITCVAATTRRIVEQEGQVKKSYFQFARFREYL
jgi:hypothetical protein